MEKIKIKHVGFDSWDREVFQTQKGTYVVDISLDYSHQNMRLCTKNNNEFDGEPDTALKTDAFEIVDDFTAKIGRKSVKRWQYDYRTESGELFSYVGASLDSCRAKRDLWLSQKQ